MDQHRCTICNAEITLVTHKDCDGLCMPCYLQSKENARQSATSIDWDAIAHCLYKISAKDINTFSMGHKEEIFYGFAFDCNAEYGDVLLCLSTNRHLKEHALFYKSKWPDLYKDKSLAEMENELRWSLGDWKYQGFNSTTFEKDWDTYHDALYDLVLRDTEEYKDKEHGNLPTITQFMNIACDVAHRLLKDNVFKALNKEKNFTVYASDHDEIKKDTYKRLDTSRKKIFGA